MTTQKNALINRILEQLPPEERYSFSQHQIESLYRSALALPKANHIINIRWSIPFPDKGFYFVFFAGQERRSRKRLLTDGDFQILPRIVLLLGSLFGCAIVFSLAYSQRMLAVSKQSSKAKINESSKTIHPTIVPFKYDQEQCETSFREWKDGQCIDHEHDHTF
ncbi:MAG: hypothetical protein AAGA83_00735 [Cyanobacteria bacterium P01_F01_bin.116]